MRHLLYTDRFQQPISRIMFGEPDPQDVSADAAAYAPVEPRPEYVRQLRLLAVHAHHTGLPWRIVTGLRTRPNYTETVPVLVTDLKVVHPEHGPDAADSVQAHFLYIDGDHSEAATAMLYTPQHGPLRPSFIHSGDLLGVQGSGAIRVGALRTDGHA